VRSTPNIKDYRVQWARSTGSREPFPIPVRDCLSVIQQWVLCKKVGFIFNPKATHMAKSLVEGKLRVPITTDFQLQKGDTRTKALAEVQHQFFCYSNVALHVSYILWLESKCSCHNLCTPFQALPSETHRMDYSRWLQKPKLHESCSKSLNSICSYTYLRAWKISVQEWLSILRGT
jgi:hypothetical protein